MSGAGGASKTGSRMVVAAVTATVAALGIGTVYLPFVADRDRVRGMHEEGEMSASDKREYEAMLKQMQQKQQQQKQQQKHQNPQQHLPTSNSMWARMNQASSSSGQTK